MPPKDLTFSERDALSASKLRSVSDAELLSFMFTSMRALRTATASTVVGSAFVQQLLTPRFLDSTIPDVQQLVACVICDVIRLHTNGAGATTARCSSIGIPLSSCDDVLRCLASPFEQILQRGAPLQRCQHIIERASASHALVHLLPHCRRPNDTATALQHFFFAIKNSNAPATAAAVPATPSKRTSDDVLTTTTTTTAVTAAEMAVLLLDILNATNAISTAQLESLLATVVTQHQHQVSATSTMAAGRAPTGTATAPPSPAYLIASRVLVAQMDLLQPALGTYCARVMEQAVSETHMTSAEADPAATRGRISSGLSRISGLCETLVALAALQVRLVVQMVHTLTPYLQHENADLRLVVLRGLGAMFCTSENTLTTYHVALAALLARSADVKTSVRAEAVQSAGEILQAAARATWSAAVQEEAWRALCPAITQRLTDPNVPVRRLAVQTLCACLVVGPSSAAEEPSLTSTLGLRTADKHPRVREAAVWGLCRVYCRHLPAWIPDAVLGSLRAEGGARVVELALESMLPVPTHSSSPRPSEGRTSNEHSGAGTRQGLAVFDFEKEELRDEQGFAGALVRLCGDLSWPQFVQLVVLARKKPQLRLTVRRLFEMRAEVRLVDPQSPEGQASIRGIHRLLLFLQGITHAERDEWDSLFRARDDKISKAFLQACSADNADWHSARNALVEDLSGRLPKETYAFVRDVLSRQIILPLQLDHVKELLDRLTQVTARRQSNTKTSGPQQAQPQRQLWGREPNRVVEEDKEEEGILRALVLCVVSSPSYLPYCVGPLLSTLHKGVIANSQSIPLNKVSSCILIFEGIGAWAVHQQSLDGSAGGPVGAASAGTVTREVEEELLGTLTRICTGEIVVSAIGGENSSGRTGHNSDGASITSGICRVVKQAAKCLLTLCASPAYRHSVAASAASTATTAVLAKLADTLCHNLTTSCTTTDGAESHSPLALVWGTAVRVLVRDAVSAPLLQSESLARSLESLFLRAVQDDTEATAEGTNVVGDGGAGSRRSVTADELLSEVTNTRAVSSAAASSPRAVAAAVTDTYTKAIAALAMSYPADRRVARVSSALDALLHGFKLACEWPMSSAGGCQRRLAIEKQLAKIVTRPSADIGKELAVAVVLSTEEDSSVRSAVQTKLSSHLMSRGCDMRYAALLLLSAVSEDSRSSYQDLKALVQSVGDHLRAKQAAEGTSLSSPQALYCYLEYAVPFVILFMAHHTYFDEEARCHFIGFQRVWHLLFNELFRHGTQCAGFLTELLSRIKQSDDVLDRDGDATRVLCDLGSRVMQECLGQRQVSTASLKHYPGAILLPNFFVKTARLNPEALLSAVYLDPSVIITAQPPFRPPAALAGSIGRTTPRQSVSCTEQTTPRSDPAASSATRASRKRDRSASRDAAVPHPSTSNTRRAAVEATLEEILHGLTKSEIAGLRWKVVRDQIEKALVGYAEASSPASARGGRRCESGAAAVEEEEVGGGGSVEELLSYAKGLLRVYYEKAPAAA